MSLLIVSLVLAVAPSFTLQKDPARALDFWVGKWRCEGEGRGADGKVQKTLGHNEITKILGDKVIQEDFSGPGLKGKSVSVYDANSKLWKQTWVDDSGGYISLTGGAEGDSFILSTETMNGKLRRMVFHDISKDGFIWDWEGSKDSGKTWNNLWHLRYIREKK